MKLEHHKFRYMGEHQGYHALVTPTWDTVNRGPLQAHAMENIVLEWLIETVDDPDDWKIGNGAAAGFEELDIAGTSGKKLCVLLKNKYDLEAFIEQFPVHRFNQDFLRT